MDQRLPIHFQLQLSSVASLWGAGGWISVQLCWHPQCSNWSTCKNCGIWSGKNLWIIIRWIWRLQKNSDFYLNEPETLLFGLEVDKAKQLLSIHLICNIQKLGFFKPFLTKKINGIKTHHRKMLKRYASK